MGLDIAPLANAIERLKEGLRRYNLDTSDEQIRDGLIQRFEFTYEASHKTLKRYIEQNSADASAIDAMTFGDLVRTANEQGLLRGDWPAWRRFRDMRARTNHTYDARIAKEVVDAIPAFIEEAVFLHAELARRSA